MRAATWASLRSKGMFTSTARGTSQAFALPIDVAETLGSRQGVCRLAANPPPQFLHKSHKIRPRRAHPGQTSTRSATNAGEIPRGIPKFHRFQGCRLIPGHYGWLGRQTQHAALPSALTSWNIPPLSPEPKRRSTNSTAGDGTRLNVTPAAPSPPFWITQK